MLQGCRKFYILFIFAGIFHLVIFYKWLVCCLTGFYRPNCDDDNDDDDDDDDDDEFIALISNYLSF